MLAPLHGQALGAPAGPPVLWQLVARKLAKVQAHCFGVCRYVGACTPGRLILCPASFLCLTCRCILRVSSPYHKYTGSLLHCRQLDKQHAGQLNKKPAVELQAGRACS